jgi:hypothetical protein
MRLQVTLKTPCILWLKNVERLNEIESQLCQLTYNEAQDAYIFCDASDKGFGGHLTTGSDDESFLSNYFYKVHELT